jgi:ParB family transcriptional regulator, chromosome partitioning protein
VAQRLKFAAVSPKLIEVYRQGGMTPEHLTAFAVSDDREAQERVWGWNGLSNSPRRSGAA